VRDSARRHEVTSIDDGSDGFLLSAQGVHLEGHRVQDLVLAPPCGHVPDLGGNVTNQREVGEQAFHEQDGYGDQAAHDLDRVQREHLLDRRELGLKARGAVAGAIVSEEHDVEGIHGIPVAKTSQKPVRRIRGARSKADQRVTEKGA